MSVSIPDCIASGRRSHAAAMRARSRGKCGLETPSVGLGTTVGTSPRDTFPNWLGLSRVGESGQRIANPPSPVRIREGPLAANQADQLSFLSEKYRRRSSLIPADGGAWAGKSVYPFLPVGEDQ